MNCKQGDLAVVIKGYAKGNKSSNIGKIVTCVRIANFDEPTQSRGRLDPTLGVLWVTDRPLLWSYGEEYLVPDSFLRPLRGDLTNDEVDTQINREAETC